MQFEPLYSLAMIAVQTGQLEQAQLLLSRAMKLSPGFAEGGVLSRGVVLLRLRRPDEALACFDRALAIKPQFAEALYRAARPRFSNWAGPTELSPISTARSRSIQVTQ